MPQIHSTRDRKVLVTGAGGAAAVVLVRELVDAGYDVVAADLDPMAVGLYLVPESRRALLPRGDDPGFADALLDVATRHGAQLVVPTVDVELPPIAAREAAFQARGIRLLMERRPTIELCLDKLALVRACVAAVRVPRTVLLDRDTRREELAELGESLIVKPRSGAGGRGVALVTPGDLGATPLDGTFIAQELLPGEEFSIDVLARPDGHVIAAVPRRRDKTDSGIAVAGRTVRDEALERFGRRVAEVIGVVGVVNVQAKRAVDGEPALLEVNPRFPGTMPLTVAAGVDMPLLAVGGAFGDPMPERMGFREVAVVRHWEDVVVPVGEYLAVEPAGVSVP
ncbi:ATP-grasp domain-containing protein [Rothia sp. AR01]|uniref:ATP-grasp domain-containing protein n=1 Tax=Rothia santali TaxID=2949643 RepID=A0A9X2HMJ0_9MICC|nr:ATP-grasp domain-containing protein [Rothia santali]MCP3427093.1 ATP-grasp domain-containing protein [Rothia santali]